MYTITKEFHFSASHTLDTLPDDHPCRQLHGHNYVVIVELQEHILDKHGFVRDYGELRKFKQMLDTRYDHKHLNNVVAFPPTAELLAEYFFNWCQTQWPETSAVTVKETPKTSAEYRE